MSTPAVADLDRQRSLIAAFAAKLERASGPVRIFETHISWILVAGDFAYKFKKAVHLPFLDFSALEQRRFYCEEELRLNRRLAPEIYLGLAAISGSADDPELDGKGDRIEYAVKMRTFSQDALWNHRLERGSIAPREMDGLAERLFAFHRDAAIAPLDSPWGTGLLLSKGLDDDFFELMSLGGEDPLRKDIGALQGWLMALGDELQPIFEERRKQGKIRECHGDLHCGNIITLDGQVTAFDCIEFCEGLRWIDVMNDIAFICMDLEFRKRDELAARLLNGYLEKSGDYDGLPVLRYYKIRRALVRCKVAWLRAAQIRDAGEDASLSRAKGNDYLAYAMQGVRAARPAILITHGLSGSGKSTFSAAASEILGAIRIRSDVERKRMQGLAPTDRPNAARSPAFYGTSATDRTYARLRSLAEQAAKAGWPVIVDATFLKREQRNRFRSLAAALDVPFFLFDIHAQEQTLRQRVAARAKENRDASDAGIKVMLDQLVHADPLGADEICDRIEVNTEAGIDMAQARKICAPISNLRQDQNAVADDKPGRVQKTPGIAV